MTGRGPKAQCDSTSIAYPEPEESEASERRQPSEQVLMESEAMMMAQDQSVCENSEILEILSENIIPNTQSTVPESQISIGSSQRSIANRPNGRRITGIRSYISTQNRCFICKSKLGRTRVPKTALKQAWYMHEIFIPHSNRCCQIHLDNGLFTDEV